MGWGCSGVTRHVKWVGFCEVERCVSLCRGRFRMKGRDAVVIVNHQTPWATSAAEIR